MAPPTPNKIAKSLSFVRNFHDVYQQALISQEHTDSLFQQLSEVAEKGKKFPVLLFSNEEEGRSLNVLVSEYHFRGGVKISQGVSKKEQRRLKDLAKELGLPLRQ
uniref:Uncharacterized protein n=1 Tax=Quercus lobata TaxID=97700 RepID=A0A7N2LE69_QUELO